LVAPLEKLSSIGEVFEKLKIQLEEEIRASFEKSMFTVLAKIKMFIRKVNTSTTAVTETHVRLPKITLTLDYNL